MALPALPVDAALPDLRRLLVGGDNAVLQAPPGAGKTTRVPLALLDEPWLAGRGILMLEPRRLAARAAAHRMAALLGEPVGETVGYRMRLEGRAGPATRVLVVTEGLLARMIQDDPALDGFGLVIFDEFHERSLQADLGLALCLDARQGLRPDLRLLVMSATLDGEAVAGLLGAPPPVSSQGRAHPVTVRHAGRDPEDPVAAAAAQVRRALAEDAGDVLVFLPGEGEIRRAVALLEGLPEAVAVAPLYGNLPPAAQDAAIAPAPPGRRKVVLATAIAETSLTIEGIGVVVDAGLARRPRFEPGSGMTRLVTEPVSRAAAEQRAGRAGRLGPGVCYRLWTRERDRALAAFAPPEIAVADLAPLALELAVWGAREPAELRWLDPPPPAAYAQARDLLAALGAVDAEGRATAHGRAMAALGAHPRLAHMILAGAALGHGVLACEVAALLSERDILRPAAGPRPADLRVRVAALRTGDGHGHPVDAAVRRRARQAAAAWRRRLKIAAADGPADDEAVGLLLALAYPDRVARRRAGGEPRYLMRNGRGARLDDLDPLATAEWLAVAHLDGARREARAFLAAPLAAAALEALFAEAVETRESVEWEAREQLVRARRQRRLGALVLEDRPLPDPPPEAVAAAMIDGIRRLGLAALPWTRDTESLRQRVMFLRRVQGADAWPDLSDAALLDGLEDWLGPYLDGVSRRVLLARLDLAGALDALIGWPRRGAVDRLAPTHLEVPSGSRVRLDYSGPEPVLAVRLQEMFGARQTPCVADGAVPVLLHLLSPARRPVQVTRDLESFWAQGYRAVKADLKGRYPRHYWPDDPLAAPPTRRARPRR